MEKVIRISVLLGVFALGGCAWAPGLQIDLDGAEKSVEAAQLENRAEEPLYNFIPITPDVLAGEKARLQATEQQRDTTGKAVAEQVAKYEYRVGPQDVLTFAVWDHPEFAPATTSGQGAAAQAVAGATPLETQPVGHRVSQSGTIFFPYVGELKVAGMTLEEVRAKVTKSISRFVRDPQVDVRIAAYRSKRVYITGEVQRPNALPVTDVPMTVTDAITRASGFTTEADWGRVRLTRDGKTSVLDLYALYDSGDLSQNLLLQDGDLINVPDRLQNKVYVLGEVRHSAVHLMNKGRMTLAEAIARSDGVDQNTADTKRVFVIRGEKVGEQPNVYHLNLNGPDALMLSTRFELKPLDVVLVSTAEVSRWNRVISQLLPSLGLYSTMQVVGNR